MQLIKNQKTNFFINPTQLKIFSKERDKRIERTTLYIWQVMKLILIRKAIRYRKIWQLILNLLKNLRNHI
jgi:hypothetical protein